MGLPGCHTGYWIPDVQLPKSKVDPQSTLLYAAVARLGFRRTRFFSGRALGTGHYTRETSHDVSNNIRGEKAILAIFSEDILWSVEAAKYQPDVMQINSD